nr:FAD-dependent oxidoreductase [uncultured Novosphingobium sp.]
MSERPLPAPAETVIVLGAGVAGLAAAAHLLDAGHDVLVLDQQNRAGGTHRSRQVGAYTFDVGSIFYEETARIFDLAPSLRELCPKVSSIQRRVAPDGSVLLYPIEPRDLLRQSAPRLAASALDLLASRLRVTPDGSLDTLCRKRLGSRFFADTGLEHYVTRFHHVCPSEIDEEFFFRRMAIIERFSRTSNLARSAARAIFSQKSHHSPQHWPMRVRPRQGFDALFDPIVRHLVSRGATFAFGERLLSLRKEGPIFKVQTDRSTRTAGVVVSTVPLDTLHRALFSQSSNLNSLDMTTLYVSADWLRPDTGNVLFNFHADGAWKRATIYSRLYPDPAIARPYFSVETTLAPGSAHDPQSTFEAFRSHAEQLGLARGLRLEGHDHVENCYPLYRIGARKTVDAVLERVAQAGVITVGRQGRFEYLPTSTGVIAQVSRHLGMAQAAARPSELAA